MEMRASCCGNQRLWEAAREGLIREVTLHRAFKEEFARWRLPGASVSSPQPGASVSSPHHLR